MRAAPIPLGAVIAERSFTLFDEQNQARKVTVRLGVPVGVTDDGTFGTLAPADTEPRTFRCPFQICGLDYGEKVFAPFGEDPFVALQYAIDLIGGLIENAMKRLELQNPCPTIPSQRDSWIWRYDHQLRR